MTSATAVGVFRRLSTRSSGAELRRFEGHEGTISSVVALPDGQTALSGSHDWTAALWEFATDTEIRRFKGHQAGINSVTVLSDGKRALSGSADRTVRLWDLWTGAEAVPIRGP